MAWGNHSVAVPKVQLVGFERRYLKNGASLEVEFFIKPEQMAVWIDDDRGFGTMTGTVSSFSTMTSTASSFGTVTGTVSTLATMTGTLSSFGICQAQCPLLAQ